MLRNSEIRVNISKILLFTQVGAYKIICNENLCIKLQKERQTEAFSLVVLRLFRLFRGSNHFIYVFFVHTTIFFFCMKESMI